MIQGHNARQSHKVLLPAQGPYGHEGSYRTIECARGVETLRGVH